MADEHDENDEAKQKLKDWLDEQEIEPEPATIHETTEPTPPAKEDKPAPLSISEQLEDGLAKLALGVTFGLGNLMAGIKFGLAGVVFFAAIVCPIANILYRLLSWWIFYAIFRSGRPLNVEKLKPRLW